jgi:hypothetical protein
MQDISMISNLAKNDYSNSLWDIADSGYYYYLLLLFFIC